MASAKESRLPDSELLALITARGSATNPLASLADLNALDQRKPFIGFSGSSLRVGYDILEDALSNYIVVANCGQAVVEQPTLSFGRSFFANGAQVSISDTVPIDDGNGNITYEPGSFGVEPQAQLHAVKLIPADYYDPSPAVHNGLVKAFRAYPAGFAGLPEPADCAEFHDGSLIGYKLGLSGVAGGFVLVNSQATKGTGAGPLVIYLFGNSSITGTLGSGTTVVQPPGVTMPYTGTATKKQWVVKNRTYSSGGQEYKWVGENTQLNAFDATNAGWLQLGGPGTPGATRDLLDLTTAFMDSVMALTYTGCDASPAASPAGSYPGQEFDATSAGVNYHYYCRRGTYVPGNSTTGAGPAWHRIQKA